jgi:hypothetical protein
VGDAKIGTFDGSGGVCWHLFICKIGKAVGSGYLQDTYSNLTTYLQETLSQTGCETALNKRLCS